MCMGALGGAASGSGEAGAETAGAAGGVGAAPFTAGASLLLPLAMKILPGLLGKKPKAPMPMPSGDPDAGLSALAQQKSFGGM